MRFSRSRRKGRTPSPPFPEVIYATNLTPVEGGLSGWSAEDVSRTLRKGADKEGDGVCPPMPSGPHGAYAGMREADALALGHYLTTIPAAGEGDYPDCAVPGK